MIHMAKKKVTPKKKPGPKAETVKVEGDWKDAVKHALKRGKPPTETETANGKGIARANQTNDDGVRPSATQTDE